LTNFASPGAVPRKIPGLLERLAEVPDPRDPRGVRDLGHGLLLASGFRLSPERGVVAAPLLPMHEGIASTLREDLRVLA